MRDETSILQYAPKTRPICAFGNSHFAENEIGTHEQVQIEGNVGGF